MLTQVLDHHYLLPEELVQLLDAAGFGIEDVAGDFRGGAFDPLESDHVVVRARKLDGTAPKRGNAGKRGSLARDSTRRWRRRQRRSVEQSGRGRGPLRMRRRFFGRRAL